MHPREYSASKSEGSSSSGLKIEGERIFNIQATILLDANRAPYVGNGTLHMTVSLHPPQGLP